MTTRTWSATASTTDWGDTPGGANANWVLAFTPDITTPAVIDATAPGNVENVSGGTLECAGVDFTGFTGTFIASASLVSAGNVIFSAGMTISIATFFRIQFNENATLTSNGKSFTYIDTDGSANITLADNANTLSYEIEGGVFDIGTHTYFGGAAFNYNDNNPNFFASSYTYSGGGLIDVTTVTLVDAYIYSAESGNIPPLYIHGNGILLIENTWNDPYDFICQSLVLASGTMDLADSGDGVETVGNMTLSGGSVTNLTGKTITVGGNFISAVNLSGGTLAVTGTAACTDGTITNMSSATDVDCTGATDGGGNTATFLFGSTASVWDGSEDNATNNDDNWTPSGEPDSTKDVEFNASSSVNASGVLNCKNIDFTGYVGEYTGQIAAFGNVTLASGMTWTDGNIITIEDDGSLDTAGLTLTELDVQACTGTLSTNVSLTESLFCYDTGNALAFGTKTITINTGASENGFYFTEDTLITYSSGAKLIGICTAGGFIDVQTDGTTLTPPVEVSGGGKLYMYPNANMASLLVTNGGAYLETATYSVAGNATFIGGEFSQVLGVPNMFDATLVVGGDLSITGMTVVNNGTLDVTGTATIAGASSMAKTTVSNMSSATDVDCMTHCIDGGGNDATFLFLVNEAPTADAGDDQSVGDLTGIVLDGSGSSDDGVGDPPTELTYLWSKVSGPGTVTFDDATSAETTCDVSVSGTYVLRLTVDDGELSDTDDVTILVDVISPTITDITTDHATGTFTALEVINIQSEIDETVQVEGTPALVCHNDGLNKTIVFNYQAGDNSTTLNWRRTALASDEFNSLVPLYIDLNGGSIKDNLGNDLDLTLPDFAQMDVAVDNGTAYAARTHHRSLGKLR